MRNALLPTLSSRLHCYGNSEFQLENLKACMQMDDLNQFHSNGFSIGSRILNYESQLGNGDYTMMANQSHSQPLIQQGCLCGISRSKDISQQSLLPSKRPSDSQYDGVRGNARKRPFEASDNMALFKRMEGNLESKITNLEPKWHEARETSEKIPRNKVLHVPVRRNQKLSDKITTLQKLVSPFGKSDTASVLQEASLYIKLLQEQIRNLFQMLSFSYKNTVELPHKQMDCGEKQVDLRSRGLCLVPISITQNVTMEDQIYRDAVSRRIIRLPKSF